MYPKSRRRCKDGRSRRLAKLNVDGAFTVVGAGTGMVLRDSEGEVIFAACRSLQHCRDATEAEILAIEEGIRLALHWTPQPFTLESDCADALKLIDDKTPNTSAYAFKVAAIRQLLKEQDICAHKIRRDANGVGHALARIGRVQDRTEVWLRNLPEEATEAMIIDCNPPIV